MTTLFRLSGGGNDFLALVEPERDPSPAEISAWCRRGLSLGADGVFTLRKSPGGARMDYWNADGRPAALCLNGTRCAARLALSLGWATGGLVLETGTGAVRTRSAGATEIALELSAPAASQRTLAVEVEGRLWEGHVVAVGVPHFVLLWSETLELAPVASLGPLLRHHAAFSPEGTNVDFARFPAPDRLEIRSFERGVEAETLACGTGVLAATAVGLALGLARLPLTALTLGGFTLRVEEEASQESPRRWSFLLG